MGQRRSEVFLAFGEAGNFLRFAWRNKWGIRHHPPHNNTWMLGRESSTFPMKPRELHLHAISSRPKQLPSSIRIMLSGHLVDNGDDEPHEQDVFLLAVPMTTDSAAFKRWLHE